MRGLFFNAQPTTDIVAHPSGFDREYDSDDFNRFMGVFFGNGVFVRQDADACKVTATGQALTVAPGIALVDGGQCHFEPGDGLTITQGDGLYSVMCRRNNAAAVRAFELVVVRGEEEYPAPVREGDLYDLCLAHVQVEGSVATVTDTREDRELCGFAALTGQPPYYPPDEANLPYILWLYVLGLPMTPEQVEAVEGNPSLMEIFNNSRLTPATMEEAEAGTDDSKIMTPLRTKEAVLEHAGFVRGYDDGEKYVIGVDNSVSDNFTNPFTTSSMGGRAMGPYETDNYYVFPTNRGIKWIHKDGTQEGRVLEPATSSTFCAGMSPIEGDKIYGLYGTQTGNNQVNHVRLFNLVDGSSITFTLTPSTVNNSPNRGPYIIGVSENSFWALDSWSSGGLSSILALYVAGVKTGPTRSILSDSNMGLVYRIHNGHLYYFESGYTFRKVDAVTGSIVASLSLSSFTASGFATPQFIIKEDVAFMISPGYMNPNQSPRKQPYTLLTIDLLTMTIKWSSTKTPIDTNSDNVGIGMGLYSDYLYYTVITPSEPISRVCTITPAGAWVEVSTPVGLTDINSLNLNVIPPFTNAGRSSCSAGENEKGVFTVGGVRSLPTGDLVFRISISDGGMYNVPMAINEETMLIGTSVISTATIRIKNHHELKLLYAREV